MAKKQTAADFCRSWGITDSSLLKRGTKWLRYQTPPEKGIYWYWFSLYVRQRDVEEYGVCISCGKPISVDTSQAGHFIASFDCGRDLLFDERNVNAECRRCNGFDENHLIGYRRNLNARYGEGTAEALEERYFLKKNSSQPVKDWKGSEYAEKIKLLPTYQQSVDKASNVG